MGWLTDRRLLAAALIAWATIAALGVILGPPLGHDESAFALIGRGVVQPETWLYRSEGTVVIAKLAALLGDAEWQLRIPSAVLSLGVPLAAYALGRAACSARTGAWAAVILAGAHPMVSRSAELLSDLPACALILGGMAVMTAELAAAEREGRGARLRLAWAAPLFAAAFYVRYGSAPVIAFAALAPLALWWRVALARPLAIVVFGAALAVLLAPHVAHSISATGSPLGILTRAAGTPRRAYVGEGLVTYFTSDPFEFYGALAGPVAALGLVSLVRMRARAGWYLGLVALAQLVSLGLASHGQPRYVYVATALLAILGVDALRRFGRFARLGASLAGAALAGAIVYMSFHMAGETRRRQPLLAATRAVAADAAGRPCSIVAFYSTQVAFYSPCDGVAQPLLHSPLPAGRVAYAVRLPLWPLDPAQVAAVTHTRPVPLASGNAQADVWRLDPVSSPP
ncbi:MAG TPA: glycosyltransferase family 39 protein [Kofleriaceae bacterium]|jgi:hypothetical protein